MSLATYDLFTDAEYEIYCAIINLINEIDSTENSDSEDKKEKVLELIQKKKELQLELSELIKSHKGIPRSVRLQNVLDLKRFKDENGNLNLPSGITWWTLRLSKRIAEFASEESRAMGLKHNDVTFDKIIVKWKSLDILEQIVLDGFTMPILNNDGSVTIKHYRFHTASAGQLRTDKIQCLSTDMYEKIHNQLECGMDWNEINSRKGINVTKLQAYTALQSSATDEWDFPIDKCIVIKDFEAPVTGMMKYIKPDYSYEIGEQTVTINHCDGIGIMLPSVSRSNFMIRGPYIKGLISNFNFLEFCKEHDVEPKIKDYWGLEHDLIKEDIQILFTESQFKLAKYYDSWEHYKKCFKENNCHLCRTNYEEDWIPDTYINYQMLQTLTDTTDDEIKQFTKHEHQRIENLTKDKESMLRTLDAEIDSDNPYKQALFYYPELLREAYSKETLKAIKKRWILDAKSGKIKIQNKRLFAIPDLYAACEFWFCGIKEPKGLLQDGEIACKIYKKYDKADVLRSPHLYREHSIQNIVHNPEIYKWFTTNGVYLSIHSLISRILQLDFDGDQLNVIVDPVIIEVAEKNIKKDNIIPLFYDANKADPELVSYETMFNGLKRAHDYSGIGQVSNSLTKLWNKPNPDLEAAAWLTYYNNLVIDAAKTGKINSYENYPEVAKKINKAIGGKRGRLPAFFEFSKNGRKTQNDRLSKRKKFAKPNNSTMNRICAQFNDIGNINFNFAGISPFNWQMLLSEPCLSTNNNIVKIFCEMDDSNFSNIIEMKEYDDLGTKEITGSYEILKESIIRELELYCGNIEIAYPHITKYLFTGDNVSKASHKQMYWRIFGEIALKNIKHNLLDCDICPDCGMKVPSWVEKHICIKNSPGFFECIDCGKLCERINSRQCRCESCQQEYRYISKLANKRKNYKKKR